MLQRTPFYSSHMESGAKLVDFGGYALPINYGSQIQEHETVRNHAGMFDVSHMTITDIYSNGDTNNYTDDNTSNINNVDGGSVGAAAKEFLRYLLSNDVAKLDKHGVGKALYSAMLNEQGGVIDDLIVYLMPFGYRLVTNGATRVKVRDWLKKMSTGFAIILKPQDDMAMLAVQGPEAIAKTSAVFTEIAPRLEQLKPFTALVHDDYFFARTGYTGEDGLEIVLPASKAQFLWQQLLNNGVIPCGLGARDTLRLEAGMNLYGHDMDESISPSCCGMDWVVDLNEPSREFIGKTAYLATKTINCQNEKGNYQVGLIMDGRGILREGQKVILDGVINGVITSGTFSPTLKTSIAIARLNQPSNSTDVKVEIRGNLEPVRIVSLPFVRKGKVLVNI